MSEQVQSPEDQGQQPVATPPPAPSIAPPVGQGPWAADLAQLFPDESVRGQVDSFIRTKIQPHTTQLEQRASAAADAQRLWDQLSDAPLDTYVAITNEMFGEDAARQMLQYLEQQNNQPPAQEAQVQQPPPQSDPRLEQMYKWYEDNQAATYYDGELARITAGRPDIDRDALHPFIAGADGDFDEAVKLYDNFVARFAPVAEQDPPPVPPPTIGSDGTALATPPTQPRKQTIAEAIDDFMAENRAAREAPPVVG